MAIILSPGGARAFKMQAIIVGGPATLKQRGRTNGTRNSGPDRAVPLIVRSTPLSESKCPDDFLAGSVRPPGERGDLPERCKEAGVLATASSTPTACPSPSGRPGPANDDLEVPPFPVPHGRPEEGEADWSPLLR